MKNVIRRTICLATAASMPLCMVLCGTPVSAKHYNDSRLPRYAPAVPTSNTIGPSMEPKNIPDFATPNQANQVYQAPAAGTTGATSATGNGTTLRADLSSTTIPVQTRLKLVLETTVDARTSQPGDIFEAHVKDDLTLGASLLLPRGSQIRGRVVDVKKPRLISRAAKIGLKLEQIVTPTGEVIPLDAALEFHKGMTNVKGQLDPGTSFGTRVENNVKSVTGLNSQGSARGALMAANIATLGAPAIATALGSSAIALFSSGDNVMLGPGQELEILLTNDLGLQIN